MLPIRLLPRTAAVVACSLSIVSSLCSLSRVSGQDWPTFRGAQRTAVATDKNLLRSWPEQGPKLVWETAGAGRGYSSVAVAGDQLYTLGDALSTKNDEEEYLTAYDRKTGKQLWATKTGPAWKEMEPDWHNSRSTPTVDGSMVYVITPKGVLVACNTADGKEVWRKDLAGELGGKKDDPWGYSESVLIDGKHLICTPGGDKATMVALDKTNGNVVWKTSRSGDIGAGHSSIVISEIGELRVYVQTTGSGALGVNAKDGKLLWSYPIEKTTAVIPTPIIRDDLVFFTAGYGRGGALLKQVPDGKGSVKVQEIYGLNPKLDNRHGGVVLIGDYIYGDSDDRGNPFCAELMTGDIKWKGRGPGKGSTVVVGGGEMLYMQFQDGEIALVQADPSKYTVVSHFKIPGSGKRPSWAHPSIADGKLYVRSQDQIFCYDITSPIVASGQKTSPVASPKELLLNGNFKSGDDHWVVEQQNGAKAKFEVVPEGPNGESALRVEVLETADEPWRLQLFQRGLQIKKGKPYVLSFWVKSSRNGMLKAICMQDHEPWEHSTEKEVSVSSKWMKVEFPFDGPWDDESARITLTNLGTEVGQVYWIANATLIQ
ncbi:MAG: PQQ-binding-like beta-propeller repeat protein [Planctomycetota bacterium]